MRTKCDNCGKSIRVQNKNWKHHFCDRKCYFEYRQNHKDKFIQCKKQDKSQLSKLKQWAKLHQLEPS